MANKENITKWVVALESGDYPQCEGVLFDGVGFCCLGVVSKLAADEGVIAQPAKIREGEGEPYYFANEFEMLPARVSDWLGVEYGHGDMFLPYRDAETGQWMERERHATEMNDTMQLSFNQIAASIRKKFLDG